MDDTIELGMLTSGQGCKALQVIGVLVSDLAVAIAMLLIHIPTYFDLDLDLQPCRQKDPISFAPHPTMIILSIIPAHGMTACHQGSDVAIESSDAMPCRNTCLLGAFSTNI